MEEGVKYIALVVALTAFLLFSFVSASFLCFRSRRNTETNFSNGDFEKGSQEAVTMCKKMSYRWQKLFRSLSEADRKGSCSICLSQFLDVAEQVRVMPVCGHVFHADCVEEWLRLHATCPMCRCSPLSA